MGKDDNRQSGGRFARGHDGGPGRPKKETEQAYMQATIKSVSLEDWQDIIRMAVALAKAGDHQARKWLSDNLMGLPIQRHEFGFSDGNELSDLTDEQIDKILASGVSQAALSSGEPSEESDQGVEVDLRHDIELNDDN